MDRQSCSEEKEECLATDEDEHMPERKKTLYGLLEIRISIMKEARFKESRNEVIRKTSSLFSARMALATEHVLSGVAKVNL